MTNNNKKRGAYMDTNFYHIIRVQGEDGEWYNNAYVENSFDAIQIAKFYKNELGYSVKLFHHGKEITSLIDGFKNVAVKTREDGCR